MDKSKQKTAIVIGTICSFTYHSTDPIKDRSANRIARRRSRRHRHSRPTRPCGPEGNSRREERLHRRAL